jgi:hypothetical protein
LAGLRVGSIHQVSKLLSLIHLSKSPIHHDWDESESAFEEKLRDVVELYMNPPENELVLCVDEMTSCLCRFC